MTLCDLDERRSGGAIVTLPAFHHPHLYRPAQLEAA
jgi:hypothetical protein